MYESKIKDGNFITVQSFMVKDLKLKGNELLVYAIIYGFSQDGETEFTGSLQYLCDWTNSVKSGIRKVLKSLCEKGFIVKTDVLINDVKFCRYKCPPYHKVAQGIAQSGIPPMSQSGTNNIYINNIDNNIDNSIINNTMSTDVDYQSIINLYNNICVSFPKVKALSNSRKKSIKARLTSGYSLSDFEILFKKAESSIFLKGGNNRNWSANFDWLIKDSNMAKVIDGNYDNKGGNNGYSISAKNSQREDIAAGYNISDVTRV